MEFENEKLEETYNKCKYVVKLWEHQFTKICGRLPSKLDIREAPDKVRSAYKTYFHLKTTSLDKSLSDLDGFDFNAKKHSMEDMLNANEKAETETWNKNIEKKAVNHDNLKPHTSGNQKKNSKAYLARSSSLKFSKRNPRKSLRLSKSSQDEGFNSFLDEDSNSVFSENLSPNRNFLMSSDDPSFSDSVTFKGIDKSRSQTINLINDLVNNKQMPMRSIDSEWLDRVAEDTLSNFCDNSSTTFQCPTELGEVKESACSQEKTYTQDGMKELYDSDHIIADSDEETNSQPSKKVKIAETSIKENEKEGFISTEAAINVHKSEVSGSSKENASCSSGDLAVSLIDKTVSRNSEKKQIVDEKRQKARERLEKKIQTGSLNDNFVKIDLKKKRYCRGKKSFNFTNYKRRQFKKMKPVATANDSLLPIEACEEESLPTIQEVSGRKKSLRASTRNKNPDNKTVLTKEETAEADECLKCFSEELALEPVEPFYNNYQESSDNLDEVTEALHKFGYSSFRKGQELAIRRILSGKSTLVTLSTGSGKSLCYMIPAYLYAQKQNCITLVVSPLVSLMDDQVANVPQFLKAACIHTNQTKAQREKVKEAVKLGKISILFVSPELLVSGERSSSFKSIIHILPPIAFACVDEAHCVSQWSHNFRPSYLLLFKILRQTMKVNTILGLTATATKATIQNIRETFQITDDEGIISDVPVPDNLHLAVSKVVNKDKTLLELLTSEEFLKYESIIIYCTRRDECERIAKFLRVHLQDGSSYETRKRKRTSVQAECYHAGLPRYKRRTIQNAFMSGELKIVVATVAFGMGINKADIRSVIHYNMPKTVETYVQEVGRAGRDQKSAYCHVFVDPEGNDKYELRRHIYGNSLDRSTIKKLLKKIFIPCSCDKECPKHEVCFSIQDTITDLDLPEENIETVLCYLELHDKKYIDVMSPAYVTCKITFPKLTILDKVAENCIILTKAIELYRYNIGKNTFEFPVVATATAMGWSSNICKQKLKNLEWTTVNNKPKRTSINVEFSDLGFRIMAPGNLTEMELDQVLNSICDKANETEKTGMLQLEAINSMLLEVVDKKSEEDQSKLLKENIRKYFYSEVPLKEYVLNDDEEIDENLLVSEIKCFLNTFSSNSFTGRAVARIFHGIQSPNFPAYVWGRTRFWKSHINIDFHKISKLASKEILGFC